jgi:hypothetical protein
VCSKLQKKRPAAVLKAILAIDMDAHSRVKTMLCIGNQYLRAILCIGNQYLRAKLVKYPDYELKKDSRKKPATNRVTLQMPLNAVDDPPLQVFDMLFMLVTMVL